MRKIDSQLNKMGSTGDAAKSQQEELIAGKDFVTSGTNLLVHIIAY